MSNGYCAAEKKDYQLLFGRHRRRITPIYRKRIFSALRNTVNTHDAACKVYIPGLSLPIHLNGFGRTSQVTERTVVT